MRILMLALLICPLPLAADEGGADAARRNAVETLLSAKDFWTTIGCKDGRKWTAAERKVLGTIAKSSADSSKRMRALKVLTDLSGKGRHTVKQAGQVAIAFRYLETHLAGKNIKRFRPELGFNAYTMSNGAAGPALLLEQVGRGMPNGGLNCYFDAAGKRIARVDHWGAVRAAPPKKKKK